MLLAETAEWIKTNDADNVDLFATKLAKMGLTRGQVMASMASKILFLNNPWSIVPMDSLARKTLKQKDNKYVAYKLNLEEFKNENESILMNSINYTNELTRIIHDEFTDLADLDVICKNRIVDKLLWTTAK